MRPLEWTGDIMNINKLNESMTSSSPMGGMERPVANEASKRPAEPAAAEVKPADMTAQQTRDVVKAANDAMARNGSDLKFRMDEDNGKPIVEIIDRQTEKVIRQIPSVEMIELSKALAKMQGVLVSKTA